MADAGLSPARFAGGIYDRTTGNLDYGQRWYDPAIGAWTQQDTVNAPLSLKTANRYAYAADDPINNTNPAGSFPCGSFTGCFSDAAQSTANGVSDVTNSSVFKGLTEPYAIPTGAACFAPVAAGAALAGLSAGLSLVAGAAAADACYISVDAPQAASDIQNPGN